MPTNTLRRFACALLVSFTSYVALSGPILTPISQERTIETNAMGRFGEDTASDADSDGAADFGPFNSSVMSLAQLATQPGTSSATASQQSQIGPTVLSGIGSASASAEAGFPFEMNASGGSFFDVTFELALPTEYLLTGQLDAGAPAGSAGQPLASLALSDSFSDIFATSTTDGSQPVFSTGILAPGTYTLHVIASAVIEASGDSATASFDFNFAVVPEPASLCLASLALLFATRRRASLA